MTAPKRAQEYQRRLDAGESGTRPVEEQKQFASVECPLIERLFLDFATELES